MDNRGPICPALCVSHSLSLSLPLLRQDRTSRITSRWPAACSSSKLSRSLPPVALRSRKPMSCFAWSSLTRIPPRWIGTGSRIICGRTILCRESSETWNIEIDERATLPTSLKNIKIYQVGRRLTAQCAGDDASRQSHKAKRQQKNNNEIKQTKKLVYILKTH